MNPSQSLIRHRFLRPVGLGSVVLLASAFPLAAGVVITEVLYAPDPKTSRVEFVEIHNPDAVAADLSGWTISGGVDGTVPAGISLAPGGYLLLCQDVAAVNARWFASARETVVAYDYSTATGSANPGTVLGGQDNWIQIGGGTALTVRNDAGLPGISGNRGYSGSTTIYTATRKNNGAFSYNIPANASTLRLSLVGRIKNTAATTLGLGIDANSNGRIDAADATGEFGFEFGFATNNWFIRQAAQGTVTNSAVSLGTASTTWYCELRVDLAANNGDGSGSLFIQQLGDSSGNPVTDTLKPVAALQNINLGIKRMSANGGDSASASWNGIHTRLAAAHMDALTIASSAPVAQPEIPMLALSGSLSNDGETLRLSDAAGTRVDEVAYRPEFPWPVGAAGGGLSMQLIHPALDNSLGGSWRSAAPTPGAQNAVFAQNAPPQIRQVAHYPEQPTSSQPVHVTAKITDPDGVATVSLIYQTVAAGNYVPAWLPLAPATLLATPNAALAPNPAFEDPANWSAIAMNDAGLEGDALAGDGIFSATIPAQANRRLLRYRITAADTLAASVRVPYADDPSLNFACFVYNGVPDWTAATRSVHPQGAGHIYPAAELAKLPVHTLVTRNADLLQCYAYASLGNTSWQIPKSNTDARSAFNWEGAFVSDGVVYDHIRYRLRQSNDRYYGNGKRSMRFRFNEGNHFQARDESGGKLPFKWSKLNTGKMSRFGGGTEYGIREIANSRLWRMFGVDTPVYYHAHMRVIDGADEAPSGADGQYNGDFFGLAMFYEDFDGAFLDNRKLPKGNIYKWKDGITNAADLQQYQARDSVADYSDFTTLKSQLLPARDEPWLRANVDWDQWYRYHTICEAIRHYDFGWQSTHWKNRGWYFMPDAANPLGKLRHIPHDHDASWYVGYHDGLTVGIAEDFAKHAIFTAPEKTAFTLEYRNTARECRDLLWKPETVNDIIDRITANIAAFSLADRDRWLSAPAAAGYEASMDPLETVPAEMKSFAFTADTVNGATLSGGRGAYLDQLANDAAIPATPVISYAGTPGYPINGVVLQTTAYGGSAAFGAIQWRLAEITDPTAPAYDPAAPPIYEITPVWDSGALEVYQSQKAVPLLDLRVGHTYRARVRHRDATGRWSHWSEPLQFTATAPDVSLYQQSLVISEFSYHPANDNEDLEFIEIMNVGPLALDMTPVRFTKGVDFDFAGSAVTSLAPGARALVVRNLAAFAAAYGSGLPVAGEYRLNDENNLSNSGERIKLSYGTGITLRDFTYADLPPWPASADGGGFSLVLIEPGTLPDHTVAGNWRASAQPGGNPGTTDAAIFAGDPAADADHDGTPALVEFLTGSSDNNPADVANRPRFGWIAVGDSIYPSLSYGRRPYVEGVREWLQVSSDLIEWTDVPFANEATGPPDGSGRIPVLLRATTPVANASQLFLRLRVTVVGSGG